MPRPDRHTPRSAPMSAREADQIAEFMAAFSAPSRLRVLYALSGVERSVDELAEITEQGSSAVSQQLRVLRLLHLVTARRDGRHMRYRLYDEHVADLLAAVRHHGEHARSGSPEAVSTKRARR